MCFPGCWCLQGPGKVTGSVGGSLSVQCRYEEEYKYDIKFWHKDSDGTPGTNIVETSEAEIERRSGRVSIRDDPAKLTFTVTLENLTEEDAGTYWCGVEKRFVSTRMSGVEVFVSPGRSHPGPVPHSSLLGSVHVWLPVLLKVPLLLSLLGAVLCVSRAERGVGEAASA
ncbi:CMRF35-like molecule 6 [Galemys pyrenaicus]|uniref:CMRF35-like molecule 6 n=1 Tax=Galemys pyrenaicus TaxID=202257 RepID=A0A8J6DLI5_GALPY|nr:CMRF35-like molecule 6 [Galemys pyrenaicus]